MQKQAKFALIDFSFGVGNQTEQETIFLLQVTTTQENQTNLQALKLINNEVSGSKSVIDVTLKLKTRICPVRCES